MNDCVRGEWGHHPRMCARTNRSINRPAGRSINTGSPIPNARELKSKKSETAAPPRVAFSNWAVGKSGRQRRNAKNGKRETAAWAANAKRVGGPILGAANQHRGVKMGNTRYRRHVEFRERWGGRYAPTLYDANRRRAIARNRR